MTREEILNKAKECVCGQREQDYGTPESNFQLIADLWNDYLYSGLKFDQIPKMINGTDVAMMMALLKIARIKNGGGTGDSFVDLAGYAACGGEINASVPKEERVNTEVKRKSGRYPWSEVKESVQKDYSIHRYCTNCKWQGEGSKGEHCSFCSHGEIDSNESHWEECEELPHICMTCRYGSSDNGLIRKHCFLCVDFNNWEERE